MGHGRDACIGPWDYDLSSHINPKLGEGLNEVVNNINNQIPCDPVRVELAKAWKTYSVPVSVPEGPQMFVNVTPKALGSPGVVAEDQGIRLLARLDADVVLATQNQPEASLGALPPNTPLAGSGGKVQLAIPLVMNYRAIEAEVTKRLAESKLEFDIPGGKAVLTSSAIEIFPVQGGVAIGVSFSAELPGRLFDSKGTIWFRAEPVVTEGGTSVRFDNIEVTRRIDNPLWQTLTGVLITHLPQAIKDKAVVKLDDKIKDALQLLTQTATDPSKTGGVQLAVTAPSLRLGRIVPTQDSLVVEGLFDAQVTAKLSRIDF